MTQLLAPVIRHSLAISGTRPVTPQTVKFLDNAINHLRQNKITEPVAVYHADDVTLHPYSILVESQKRDETIIPALFIYDNRYRRFLKIMRSQQLHPSSILRLKLIDPSAPTWLEFLTISLPQNKATDPLLVAPDSINLYELSLLTYIDI